MTTKTLLFTLRLWPERVGAEEHEWRGKIQYLPGGETRYFRDWTTLVQFLQETLARHETAEAPPLDADWSGGKLCGPETALHRVQSRHRHHVGAPGRNIVSTSVGEADWWMSLRAAGEFARERAWARELLRRGRRTGARIGRALAGARPRLSILIRRGAQTAHLLVTRFDPVMTGFRAALLALRTPARMVIVPGELGAERSFMVKAWIMQPGLGVLPGCRLSRFIGR